MQVSLPGFFFRVFWLPLIGCFSVGISVVGEVIHVGDETEGAWAEMAKVKSLLALAVSLQADIRTKSGTRQLSVFSMRKMKTKPTQNGVRLMKRLPRGIEKTVQVSLKIEYQSKSFKTNKCLPKSIFCILVLILKL